jgi:hypothetical protein
MVNSAEKLMKYKKALRELKEVYPKGAVLSGFTIDISFGRDKRHEKLSIESVATSREAGTELLNIVILSLKYNIDFWEKAVIRDIKELQNALKTH